MDMNTRPAHLKRSQHYGDRDETYPADERFFEKVAAEASTDDPIVVIGHGRGQSNEADHLTAHLKRHHPMTYEGSSAKLSPTSQAPRRPNG